MFPLLNAAIGTHGVLVICAGVSLLGCVWTLAFVPAYDQRALEEIAIAERTLDLTQCEIARIAREVLYAGPSASFRTQEAIPIQCHVRNSKMSKQSNYHTNDQSLTR